ncbi:hypothetical protein Lal_00038012 [Lupinus albus]|nr:hypothetical protein Lal_00038012 [Lupinus albus]
MQGSRTGFGLVYEWDNYDRKGFCISLCRISKEEIKQRNQQGFGETVKNKDSLSTGYLKLEERLLHYFLNYVILPKFSNPLDGETKVALNPRESKIYVEVVHKMGFIIDLIDRRTYRLRTDRPIAPTAQPKPTIPNPPEFQAPSSSSAAMPSLIMDELISLRGYITTRMDALDTQNQQTTMNCIVFL